jgi:hypothetical protein
MIIECRWILDKVNANSRNWPILQEYLLGKCELVPCELMDLGTSGIGSSVSDQQRGCQKLHALLISSHVHGFMINNIKCVVLFRECHRASRGDVANIVKTLENPTVRSDGTPDVE